MIEKRKIWALILAGGESKRMGLPKMLLPFRGLTMIENVIVNIKKSGVKNILVVLGAEKVRISTVLKNYPVSSCFNPDYKEGMLSSVISGISNLPEDIDALLIFPGDEPLIRPESINKVIEAFFSSGNNIAIPVFQNKRGHPLMIGKKYLAEVSSLNPSIGLRELSERHSDDIIEVETDDPGILKDFDTFEEYIDELNQIS